MRLTLALFVVLALLGLSLYFAGPGAGPEGPGLGADGEPTPAALAGSGPEPVSPPAGAVALEEGRREVEPLPEEVAPGRHAVFGRVQDDRGGTLAGVAVALMPGLVRFAPPRVTPYGTTESREDGSWKIVLNERPERLLVLARKEGFVGARADVTPGSGEATEVPVLVLERGAAVEGLVVDEGGSPVPGALVSLPWTPGRAPALIETRTDAGGRYRLDGIAAGKVRLSVDAEGFALAFQDLELVLAALPQRVDFKLSRGLFLAGRVFGASGLPVAGAEVRVIRRSERAGVSIVVMGGGESVTTDAAGRFAIGGLEPGRYDLHASAEGHLPSRREAVEAGDQGIVLTLGLGGGVRGVVQGPAGEVLERGTVECRPASGALVPGARRFDPGSLASPGRAERGAGKWGPADQGAFEVVGLEPGLWRVRVAAEGLAPRAVEANVVAGVVTDLGTIRLEQGAWLEVTVFGQEGQPLGDVRVEALLASGAQDGMRALESLGLGRQITRQAGQLPLDFLGGQGQKATGRTDAEGRCRLEGLASGTWTVEASHPGFAPGKAGPFDLVSGQGQEARVGLTPGGNLVVLVRDRKGVPQAGTRVEVEGPERRTEATDAHGFARFMRLAPGTYAVGLPRDSQVRLGQLQFGTRLGGEGDRVTLQVPEGETARLELTAPSTWTMRGTVAGPFGPAAGVRVFLEPSQGRLFGTGPETKSGPDGSWRLEGVAPGAQRLRWSRPGALVAASRTLELGEEGGEWDGHLELPTGVIEGRVLDAEGAPVAGVQVTLAEPGRGAVQVAQAIGVVMLGGGDRRLPRLELPGQEMPEPVFTDAEGRFRVEQVPAGPWQVGTRGEDGTLGKGPVRVEVPEGGTVQAQPRL